MENIPKVSHLPTIKEQRPKTQSKTTRMWPGKATQPLHAEDASYRNATSTTTQPTRIIHKTQVMADTPSQSDREKLKSVALSKQIDTSQYDSMFDDIEIPTKVIPPTIIKPDVTPVEIEQPKILKPVFIPKSQREEIIDQQKIEDINFYETQTNEKRKKITKEMVIQEIKSSIVAEQKAQEVVASDEEIDDSNEQISEYEQWKLRELRRITRDNEERERTENEKKEIERRRNLTDAQREEENKKLGTDETDKVEKSKYVFMQKYYHGGSYFQNQAKGNKEHIYNRDYNMALDEEKFDKSVLPSSLMKRNGQFGKKGQTKWTHLTREDTSSFDPQYKINESISKGMTLQSGGYKGMNELNRPSRYR